MIRQDFIDRLLEQADIVDVISSLIDLKKAGANYRACCPFHNEHSPSFNVNRQRQTYKCFGCGKSGKVIGFVMDYKRLTYPEAIQFLADYYSLPVEYDTPARPKSRFSNIQLR